MEKDNTLPGKIMQPPNEISTHVAQGSPVQSFDNSIWSKEKNTHKRL